MSPAVPHLDLLGVRVACLDRAAALGEMERCYDAESPALVAFVNAHTLTLANRDPRYHHVLKNAALVFNDGVGVAMAARLHGSAFPANLNGSDFTIDVLRLAARRAWPVYFLGSHPGVAVRAAERLQAQVEGLRVAGARDGFFTEERSSEVALSIKASGAALLVVAMGNPLQELWLSRHLAGSGARIGIGVGAFLDFASGKVRRAPQWMNRAGVEWLYRFWQEPERLWRRYTVEIPEFLGCVIGDRLGR